MPPLAYSSDAETRLKLGEAWRKFKGEHAAELPAPGPAKSEQQRTRQRAIGRLYMEFLRLRGNPFLQGKE